VADTRECEATIHYMYFERSLFSFAILRYLILCNLYDMHHTTMYGSHFMKF